MTGAPERRALSSIKMDFVRIDIWLAVRKFAQGVSTDMMADRRQMLTGALAVACSCASGAARAVELSGIRHDGKALVDADLPGWKLVYFGYTHCPDVCPMGLQSMTLAVDALGPLGERMTPVFVSVDPERDTPQVLAQYITYFHPRTVGVSPPPDQLAALAAAWRVKYARVEGKDGRDYTVDHTSTIFLVDPSGAILARLPHDLDGRALADRIRSVILKR